MQRVQQIKRDQIDINAQAKGQRNEAESKDDLKEIGFFYKRIVIPEEPEVIEINANITCGCNIL